MKLKLRRGYTCATNGQKITTQFNGRYNARNNLKVI